MTLRQHAGSGWLGAVTAGREQWGLGHSLSLTVTWVHATYEASLRAPLLLDSTPKCSAQLSREGTVAITQNKVTGKLPGEERRGVPHCGERASEGPGTVSAGPALQENFLGGGEPLLSARLACTPRA